MNESLAAWRRYYCDSSAGWQQCARYIRSSRGEVVPLGLLPNGRHAQHIQTYADHEASAEPPPATLATLPPVPDAAATRRTAGTPSSTWTLPGAVEHSGRFEPMRTAGPHTPAQPAAPPAIPQQRLAAGTARPRTEPAVRRSRRRWWTRLTDWMKGRHE